MALPKPLATFGDCMPFDAAVDALSAARAGAAVEAGQLGSLGVTFERMTIPWTD